ncbi:uncharacterized protein LOC6501773 isoform X4 [Drosophila ananassae]|uniref:uncharacterized protein LOC6501773 isoform X4 n=1 Tax=Drosophila ananassae TaxID=7217 RepID=UPI001CFF8596|nr:uncharacterized protein LOC6501773 isoform X4 [Drosophila ananassae]
MEEKQIYDRIRQRKRRQHLLDISLERKNQTKPYRTKQTLAKVVKKVESALPKDLAKKLKVLEVLIKKYKKVEDEVQQKPNRKIFETSIQTMIDFYQNDNISVQAAGKKDTLVMLLTVSEAYETYKNYFPTEKIGLSTFFKMRPRHVQLANKMPHNMCVCMYPANFGYMLQSCAKIIPSIPKNFEKFLKAVCCDIQNEYCMTSSCKNCLNDIKNDLIPLAYFPNMEEEVNWQQWRKIDNHLVLTNTTATVNDLLQDMQAKLSSFKTHFFVKRAQQGYFEETKMNLKPFELVLQIDFAENYRLTHQNEIQSAHFSYQQVTIFTCVAWMAGTSKSFAVISDKLTHNKHDVYIFLLHILNEIKKIYGLFWKLIIFSDGSCAQFKNKYILTSLADILEYIGCLNVEWNFFASSHGKGAVDGVGAVIKRKVWQITKSQNLTLSDAISFYRCAVNNLNGVKMYYISSAKINNLSLNYNLDKKWKDVPSIPGICQMHWFSCSGQLTEFARTAYSIKTNVYVNNKII